MFTVKQPAAYQPCNPSHAYSPLFSPGQPRSVPSLPPLSSTEKSPLASPFLPASKPSVQLISSTHRSLPPPAATTSPQLPTQQQIPPLSPPPLAQPAPLSQSLGQLPAPPQQWQGAEESMANWLLAKAEEDRRRQEEEKTRQQVLRLEQRKIEQDMLRTSLNGGIPPNMLPMVFAIMRGGSLPHASLEWVQHRMDHVQQQQQEIQPQQQLLPSQSYSSPEQEQQRDLRTNSQLYRVQQQHQLPMTLPSIPVGPSQETDFVSGYPMSPGTRSKRTSLSQGSIPGPLQTAQLPGLNTGEIRNQPLPDPTMQMVPAQLGHPLRQTQIVQQQQETQSSSSIYFHHWRPPTPQAGTRRNQPANECSSKH